MKTLKEQLAKELNLQGLERDIEIVRVDDICDDELFNELFGE